MYAASFDGGSTFTKPTLVANINPFDQGETSVSFRTNDYPAIAVDAASHVYVAWSQRDVGNVSTTGGDARVIVATGIPTSNPKNVPLQWSAPQAVDPWSNRGHQIIPAMAFSAGKLTVAWYDLRNDDLLAMYTPLGVSGQYSQTLENDGGAPDFPAFGNLHPGSYSSLLIGCAQANARRALGAGNARQSTNVLSFRTGIRLLLWLGAGKSGDSAATG